MGKKHGPATEHEMKSIGFVNEPFSLQNHQIFKCKRQTEMSKFKALPQRQALDLTSLRLGSKAFNKKSNKSKMYVVQEEQKREEEQG